MNPANATGPAWGLMQIVEVVRNSYNKRHGTSYPRNALLDPEVNVKIGTDLLRRISAAYAAHPDPNLKPDWSNPEFVKLVTAGWNSGYSEGGGVGKIASWLEERGIPVTHDNVFHYAPQAAPKTAWLFSDAKRRWQAAVAELYFAQPDAGGGGRSLVFRLAVAAAVGYFGYKILEG